MRHLIISVLGTTATDKKAKIDKLSLIALIAKCCEVWSRGYKAICLEAVGHQDSSLPQQD